MPLLKTKKLAKCQPRKMHVLKFSIATKQLPKYNTAPICFKPLTPFQVPVQSLTRM